MSKKQARIAQLADAVVRSGMMPIRNAAALLGVSEMTVRRDVAESDGLLAALGGYVISETEMPGSYALDLEEESHLDAKAMAAALALDLIEPEDTLFLDCGTTMPHLARKLPVDQHLTVICYSLNIADILAKRGGTRVLLIGGLYHPSSASFSGDDGLEVIKRVRINKAFISAGGLHADMGASCSNFYEVPAKRAALDKALRSYVVADTSKYGKVKPAFFADCKDFSGAINEQGLLQRADFLRTLAGILEA
jgi:DeoR family deoxyribose operon repressor